MYGGGIHAAATGIGSPPRRRDGVHASGSAAAAARSRCAAPHPGPRASKRSRRATGAQADRVAFGHDHAGGDELVDAVATARRAATAWAGPPPPRATPPPAPSASGGRAGRNEPAQVVRHRQRLDDRGGSGARRARAPTRARRTDSAGDALDLEQRRTQE
jgi:hypothetical protein